MRGGGSGKKQKIVKEKKHDVHLLAGARDPKGADYALDGVTMDWGRGSAAALLRSHAAACWAPVPAQTTSQLEPTSSATATPWPGPAWPRPPTPQCLGQWCPSGLALALQPSPSMDLILACASLSSLP